MTSETPSPAVRPCPICDQPAVARYRPFCSSRCADIDLGRWLKGVYAVPAREDESEGERTDSEDEGA
jgi:hypothetical protein